MDPPGWLVRRSAGPSEAVERDLREEAGITVEVDKRDQWLHPASAVFD